MENEQEICPYNLFLYQKRNETNLSIKEFANKLEINRFKYNLIEKGYLKPNKKDIEKISKYFNVDYSLYTTGMYSYPEGLTYDKSVGKLGNKINKLINKLSTKIVMGIITLVCIITIVLSLVISDSLSENQASGLSDEYLAVYDGIVEKGSTMYSLTDELKSPEIYLANDSQYSYLRCRYSSKTKLDFTYSLSLYTDEGRITMTSSSFDTNSKETLIKVTYCDYTDYELYQAVYNEISKNQFVLSEAYASQTGFELSEDSYPVIEECLMMLNYEMSDLIKNNLNLDVDFYDTMIAGSIPVRDRIEKGQNICLMIFILGLILVALNCYLFIYALLYGNKYNEITILQASGYNDDLIRLKQQNKKLPNDFKITPPLPETLYWAVGTILTFAGVIRIVMYVLTFFNSSFTLETNKTASMLFTTFVTGTFLLFFIKFDQFLDDKRSIKNVFLNLILFFCLYLIEVVLQQSIEQVGAINLILKSKNFTLPNYFGSVACYFLMMITLFLTPKWANKKWKLILYRLLTLIPIAIIVTTTIIRYGNTAWNLNLPTWVAYLFTSQRPQISILCITYLIGLYFLRLFFKLRYGPDACKTYFNGNRYLIYKNILVFIIVLVIGIFEIALQRNTGAHSFGFGLYDKFIYLAPFLLLYHPHIGDRNKKWDSKVLAISLIVFAVFYFLVFAICIAAIIG